MTDHKFCVTCEHHGILDDMHLDGGHACMRVYDVQFEPVTGKGVILGCSVERSLTGGCKPAGNYWVKIPDVETVEYQAPPPAPVEPTPEAKPE